VTVNNEGEFIQNCDKCVPVTMALRVLWLRLEENSSKYKHVRLSHSVQNVIYMQPLTAVITCVHVSEGVFKTINLLFQQTALVADDI